MISTSRMSGTSVQRRAALGEQRGRHQLEHAVLGAGHAHLAGQPGTADDAEPVHLDIVRVSVVSARAAWSTSPASTPAPATTARPASATSAGSPRPTPGSRRTPTSTRPAPSSAWRWRPAPLDRDVATLLTRVQNDLFDVGADLCTPVEPDPEYPPLRVEQAYVDALEARDRPVQRRPRAAAVLRPGRRHAGAALLHVARTVVRRAERSTWRAVEAHPDTMNPLTATYLNRLSDLLFILARAANRDRGDVLWVPGANR